MIASIADLVAFLKRFHRHWLDDPRINPALIPADLPPPLGTIYRDLEALLVPLLPDIVREFRAHTFLELGHAGLVVRG